MSHVIRKILSEGEPTLDNGLGFSDGKIANQKRGDPDYRWDHDDELCKMAEALLWPMRFSVPDYVAARATVLTLVNGMRPDDAEVAKLRVGDLCSLMLAHFRDGQWVMPKPKDKKIIVGDR